MKAIILFIIFSLFPFFLNGQIVVDTTDCVCYSPNKHNITLLRDIRLRNIGKDTCIMWLSNENLSYNNDRECIYDYFRKRRGDFCFLDLINDGSVYSLEQFSENIFLKQLYPTSNFHIVIENSYEGKYNIHFFYFKKSLVENILHTTFDKRFFYENEIIILSD